MIPYSLPTSLEVGGVDYQIRTDYRAVMDILSIYADPELSNEEKAIGVLDIFYFSPGREDISPQHLREAMEKCAWFLDGGDQPMRRERSPILMNWEQDFRLVIAPINRVHGLDIRSIPYDPETNQGGVHWWTFLGDYLEIGDCLFAQIVRIRDKKIRGKRLDKQEQEFYRHNRELVDFQRKYTESDQVLLKEWGAG